MNKHLYPLNCLRVLLILGFVVAPFATASSPCNHQSCLDAASAAFLAPLDLLQAQCSKHRPEQRETYKKVLAWFLRNEDSRVIQQLRTAPVYLNLRTELEAEMKRHSSDELKQACDALLNEYKAATSGGKAAAE